MSDNLPPNQVGPARPDKLSETPVTEARDRLSGLVAMLLAQPAGMLKSQVGMYEHLAAASLRRLKLRLSGLSDVHRAAIELDLHSRIADLCLTFSNIARTIERSPASTDESGRR